MRDQNGEPEIREAGKTVFCQHGAHAHSLCLPAFLPTGSPPPLQRGPCSQIYNRALLHTARWPRLSNLALRAICRPPRAPASSSCKQWSFPSFPRNAFIATRCVCLLSACRLFQDLHSYIEERGAEVSEGSKTLTTRRRLTRSPVAHPSLAIKSSFIIICLRRSQLAPSLTPSLARAEKELFSRDIGILRGQIKTTL